MTINTRLHVEFCQSKQGKIPPGTNRYNVSRILCIKKVVIALRKRLIAGLLLVFVLSFAAIPVSQASLLGDVIKVGGIGLLVDRFADQLNSFINTLTAKHNVGTDYATKVVPIVTLGSGGYIGAAQVTGPSDLVAKTKAVLQLEGNFSGRQFRVKALIPIDSKNPVNFSRVQGVGVSAIIDVKI